MSEKNLELEASIIENAQNQAEQTMQHAYSRVAPAIKEVLPDIWAQAVKVLGSEENAIRHLTSNDITFFNGKSALQTIIDDQNTQRVQENLNAMKYGAHG